MFNLRLATIDMEPDRMGEGLGGQKDRMKIGGMRTTVGRPRDARHVVLEDEDVALRCVALRSGVEGSSTSGSVDVGVLRGCFRSISFSSSSS